MIVKVCRDCGEEYRPEILRCADCGGELEPRSEEERAAWPDRERRSERHEEDPRPAGDYRPILWRAYAAELTPLADRLLAAEVPFYLRPRLVEGGGVAGYEVRVRQEERERALREIEALQREGALGAAEDVVALPGASAPPSGEGDSTTRPVHCPACGASLADGTGECPDCGLAFTGEVEE